MGCYDLVVQLPDMVDVILFHVVEQFPDVVGKIVNGAFRIAQDVEPFPEGFLDVDKGLVF
jgi:hypothetical protein